MTYFPMGAVEPSDFVSRAGGICKPTNQETLDKVRDFQHQLNRVAYARKAKMIAKDGDVGPATLAALQAALGVTTDCMTAAMRIDTLASQANQLATSLGAPDEIPGEPIPAKRPTFVNVATNVEVAAAPQPGASALDSVKNLGVPTLLALGVAVVGAGYYLTKKGK